MPKKFRMCARNNITRGGGLGMTYQFGEAVVPGFASVQSVPSCGGVARPGMIGSLESSAITGNGVMNGGVRKRSGTYRRRRRASRTRKQRGGTYAADFDNSVVFGTRGAYMPIKATGCAGAPGHVGGGEEALTETTARYEFKPSDFVGSTGTPVALSVPIKGSADCVSMPSLVRGGGRSRRRARGRGRRSPRSRMTRR
jgi:hypothetical protein